MKENLRVVHIGNFAMPKKGDVYTLKSYSKFLNELTHRHSNGTINVFAGYIKPGETGFEFSYEERLNDQIRFTLSKGNTPNTKLLPFIFNNFVLFLKLTLFSLKKGDYFIFLPSPIGVWSALVVTLFAKKQTLGLYIGGYYKREQAFEKRSGFIKKIIKKIAAVIVEELVSFSIRRSDYIITPSYELHHSLKSTKKIFLTPPMINVDEGDLNFSFTSLDNFRYITYCGELRHAKGVMDLLKAFAMLVNEYRIEGYKLKIIGSGQAQYELINFSKANNLKDLVVFCGQIKDKDQLKEAIGQSTIFVLPSYSEGFPRVAYECFTLGVPTILTPVGGIPFFLKDNVHTLFTDPGNVANLASKIEELTNNDQLRLQLSTNAKHLMKASVFPRIKNDVSLSKLVLDKIAGI